MQNPPPTLPILGKTQTIISARKTINRFWPDSDKAEIEIARRLYDAGTHDLATKKFNGWFWLILVARSSPTLPRIWFQTANKRNQL